MLRNAATVECLPGKRSWIIKAFIVTFMPKKSLFLYFPFGMVCVPARLYSILNQWIIDDWKFGAYRLFIDYSLNIGYNQWLINWLPIDYLLINHWFIDVMICHRLVTFCLYEWLSSKDRKTSYGIRQLEWQDFIVHSFSSHLFTF